MKCPFCNAKAVETTCMGDRIRTYYCVGSTPHDFTEGEVAPPESADDTPEISVDDIADALAKRLHQSRPSLLKRLIG